MDIGKGNGLQRKMANKRLTFEEYEKRLDGVEGIGKYVLHGETFTKLTSPFLVTCKKHGDFMANPIRLMHGYGCRECGKERFKEKKTTPFPEILKKCREVYGDEYDYVEESFINIHTPMTVICHKHGEFPKTPINHIYNHQGCPKCALEERRKGTERFINEAREIYGDDLDYSLVDYENAHKPVKLICHKKNYLGKEHGVFEMAPCNLLNGHSCPRCKQSKLEVETSSLLDDEKIPYVPQKTFDWLKNKGRLYLDFFLPDYNLAIECQGRQHFEPSSWGEKDERKILEAFEDVKKRDALKKRLCEEHGIKMEYINYNDNVKKRFKEIVETLRNKVSNDQTNIIK